MSLEWSVKAASIAGVRHRQKSAGAQDAFYFQQPQKGLLIAAVADGAGSAPHSAIGARVASKSVVEWLVTQQHNMPAHTADVEWRVLLDAAMEVAAKAVVVASREQNIPLPELATTLIVVVARPDFAAAAQVGDGVVIVTDTESNLFALTAPQHGEYRNDTIFLNSKGASAQMAVTIWSGTPVHVALMTDGLELLALNIRDGAPHAPFFEPLWKFSKDDQKGADANALLASFLASPRIASRTDDDLTLVLGCLKKDEP